MNPSQTCKYLGFLYNLKKMIVELPDSKRNQIITEVDKIKSNQSIKIRDFAKIVGILVSCCPAVNYGWGHTKVCERIKFVALLKSNNNYNSRLIITNQVL